MSTSVHEPVRATFEMIEDRKFAGQWRVEEIDFQGEGECQSALFLGSHAEERAREYMAWKNQSRTDSRA